MNSYVTAMQTFTTQMAKVNLVTSFWPEDHRTWQVPDPEGAPDVMGYVRGYRAFRYEQHTHMASYSPMDWSTQPPTKRVPLETRMSLRSLNHEYEWLNRRGHAVCGSARPHKAPDPNCSCGFYAVFDPRRVPGIGRYDYGYDSAGYVLASVKAWGNIIEASDGFRAEYMEIEHFHALGIRNQLSDRQYRELCAMMDVTMGVPFIGLDKFKPPWEPEINNWEQWKDYHTQSGHVVTVRAELNEQLHIECDNCGEFWNWDRGRGERPW